MGSSRVTIEVVADAEEDLQEGNGMGWNGMET